MTELFDMDEGLLTRLSREAEGYFERLNYEVNSCDLTAFNA